jgi:type IV pilus assembly protein PilN
MIRINLLGVERQKVRKSVSFLDPQQRATFGCCLVFGLTVLGISAWYWSLTREAARLDQEIATAQQEATALQAVLLEIKRGEEHRAQLQQRVAVIQQLRDGQSVPVQLLDHVSRSLPDMLWLSSLDQKPDAVSIEGRTTTLISLADFVANLGTNALMAKPIDIVNSQVESSSESPTGADLIKFSVKAPLAAQSPAAGTTAAGAPGAAPAATAPQAAAR